jgi:phospholipid/cholesterol/gamma-HCH transport system substrate-binding protein
MAFQISNETKVGALAAISITFLVLGYNFLAGRGSLFSKKYTLHTVMDDVNEVNTSTPVLFHGYKVGNVKEIKLANTFGKFDVAFVLNEKLPIPDDTKVKVVGSLLNGKSLNLILGKSTSLADNNSFLTYIADTSVMEAVGFVLKPLNAKINSIVNSLDSLLSNGELNRSIVSLNKSLQSFTKTSDNASALLEKNMPKIADILTNVQSITGNLKNNNESINKVVANLKTTTDNLAAAKLKEAVDNANQTLAELNAIMMKVNSGQGSLGLLVNDKELYNNLNKTAFDLDVILKDLNKHPAKYIPIPFTKKQRKKAIEASNQQK